MTRTTKSLFIVVVAFVGLWGCAQGPANTANADRLKALEAKINKLEDENKAIVAGRDQLRKKLGEVEDQKANLLKDIEQGQNAAKERDDLRLQLTARTVERDGLQGQFDQLRKALRGMLTQVEAMSNANGQPVTAADAVGGSSF